MGIFDFFLGRKKTKITSDFSSMRHVERVGRSKAAIIGACSDYFSKLFNTEAKLVQCNETVAGIMQHKGIFVILRFNTNINPAKAREITDKDVLGVECQNAIKKFGISLDHFNVKINKEDDGLIVIVTISGLGF